MLSEQGRRGRPRTFRRQAQRQEDHVPRARTQLRLARTHATHERIEIEVEIEIAFPVQGVLTELTTPKPPIAGQVFLWLPR